MNVFSRSYLDWIAEQTKNGEKIFYTEGSPNESLASGIEELFKEVDAYAKTFYYFNTEEFGSIYNVRDKNNFYTLSLHYGPLIGYSIRRDEGKANYLDLADVERRLLSGKENLVVFEIMQEINHGIKRLKQMGVPMDTVRQEIDREVRTKQVEEQGPIRVLKQ